MSNSAVTFWVEVNDGQNRPSFRVQVETETGSHVALLVQDRETLETLARLHVPEDACSLLGQALMLASTAKAGER